jgi:hypothetical protein
MPADDARHQPRGSARKRQRSHGRQQSPAHDFAIDKVHAGGSTDPAATMRTKTIGTSAADHAIASGEYHRGRVTTDAAARDPS